MYSITQKHPQYREIIPHPDQETLTDCQKFIIKTAGINAIDMDNIQDKQTEFTGETMTYHISGSDYVITNLALVQQK
jgi:hypothetical protein